MKQHQQKPYVQRKHRMQQKPWSVQRPSACQAASEAIREAVHKAAAGCWMPDPIFIVWVLRCTI